MKAFLLSVLATIIISGFTNSGNKDDHKTDFGLNSSLNLNFEKSFPENTDESKLKNSDWYNTALSGIQKAEYNIVFDKELNEYQSPNRANNMRLIYHKDGFTAKLRDNKIPLFDKNDKLKEEKDKKYKYLDEWNLKLVTKNISRENGDVITIDMEQSEMQASGNTAFIENENIRTEYTNNEDGMRQDFIIKTKPEGEGRLKLNIESHTKLIMILSPDELIFKDNKEDVKLKYSSLKCWDANGKELRAYFGCPVQNASCLKTKSESNPISQIPNQISQIPNQENSKFSIVVDDKDVVYPVTIDPLSSTPSWNAQINQASANFGWSVATAGDVNGDGYSEVIIGAPYYDHGHTDEGGVFVYYGSINGLSLAPDWTKEIDQTAALFGWSVATAGDINGDGYSDVLIGSPTFDNGQTDEGKAFLFTGSSAGLSNTETWSKESDQSGANYGYSVACAGDLNNDALSDVIIGAPFYDNGHTNEGIAHVFKSNGTTMVQLAWAAEGNQTDAHLGFSVSTAGDVNGDNYSDILVGAYKYNNTFSNDGRVYAYYSTSTTYPASPSWTINGTQVGEYYGYSVSTAGDVNGDGYSDVIIGSPLFDGGQTDEGKTFIYHGSSTGLLSTVNWTAEGNETGGQLGISVSTAGDINGDGYADVIAGGNYMQLGQTDEGLALLFLGSASGTLISSSVAYRRNQSNSGFGFSVATAGDVNGDGFSDVIVGAYEYDDPSTDEGAVFVYYGAAAGISSVQAWSAEGGQSFSHFGNSVSSAGDVNGDGYSDVIIGASIYDNGHTDEGAAFLFMGSPTGLSTFPNWAEESNQANAFFGYSVSTAGDVNGDGYSDVIVGAPGYENGQVTDGAVFIYLGSATGLSVNPHIQLNVNGFGYNFGCEVSCAGDVNGDGFQDIIIGSKYWDAWKTIDGAAFVYLGSPIGILPSSQKILAYNQLNTGFGIHVSGAGDVNGDGYSDVIVGAPAFDSIQNDAGAAFLFQGSASGISTTINWRYLDTQTGSAFGSCLSEAGDVNGDGYSDIVIGASGYKNAITEVGRVSIFHGSPTGLSSNPDRNINGLDYASRIAKSVSSAGDINGDGYADIVIGGFSIDLGGAVYIYPGSQSGISSTLAWTKNNFPDNSNFGSAVSSAGDVNGDGYSDLIFGGSAFSNGQQSEGAAYVFYGGSNQSGSRSNLRQYKPLTSAIVSSGMNSGTDGSIQFRQFGRSPFGKSSGRIVFDIQPNGVPFQGSIISNSTAFTTASSYLNFGLTGTDVSKDVSSLNKNKLYKWRSRVQYSMTSFPFQKFGPWRYFNSYTPDPQGNFRPRIVPVMLLNLTMFIQGFYDPGTDLMVEDTVRVYLRNSSSPYAIIDSAIAIVNSSGAGTFTFTNAINGVNYYLQLKHRNSIETWSMTPQQFTSSTLTYNFTTSSAQAFGNNMTVIDTSPQKFGIYGGDINQEGNVDLSDILLVYNDASSFVIGYVNTDVNGDNITDLSDLLITYNNAANFVAVKKP